MRKQAHLARADVAATTAARISAAHATNRKLPCYDSIGRMAAESNNGNVNFRELRSVRWPRGRLFARDGDAVGCAYVGAGIGGDVTELVPDSRRAADAMACPTVAVYGRYLQLLVLVVVHSDVEDRAGLQLTAVVTVARHLRAPDAHRHDRASSGMAVRQMRSSKESSPGRQHIQRPSVRPVNNAISVPGTSSMSGCTQIAPSPNSIRRPRPVSSTVAATRAGMNAHNASAQPTCPETNTGRRLHDG